MKRLMSALVALPLLLAFALPVAAVDETPTPEATLITETPACPPVDVIDGVYVIPENAPEGCMYIQGGGDPSVEPMPIDPTTGDCAPELALAVAAGETPIAPAPCLLPDGTLYELASRGTMPNERGDGDVTDYATMYEEWMAEFKATLEPCAEGADLNDISLVTCLLPDGSIAGPVPMFAGAPEMIEDVTSTTAEGSSEVALPVAIVVIALVGLSGAFLIRRRTTL
jgi:hypothetical protein